MFLEGLGLSYYKYDLMSDDLMTASEASKKWGFEESYVRQIVKKYPERIPEGELRLFGKTLVITAYGMEKLTGRSLEDPWYFCFEKQQMIFKEVKYASYEEALDRLKKELERHGIGDYSPSTIDDQKQRIGFQLNDGSYLFITKRSSSTDYRKKG